MKAVSEIRKDSIRITDKEGYDVKNIKQKKKKIFHWKKKYLQTYLPIFQKEKETFFFLRKKKEKET